MLLWLIFLVPLIGNIAAAEDCKDDNNFHIGFNQTCKELFSGKYSNQDQFCLYPSVKKACCKECPNVDYDTSQNNVIEVSVYVDPAAVRKYKGFGYSNDTVEAVMRDEIRYYFHEMNEMYGTLAQYGLQISLSLTDIKFMDKDVLSKEEVINGDAVDARKMLNDFTDTFIGKARDYDANLLYTGYNLVVAPNYDVAGYGRVGALCQKNIVPAAIMEMSGTYLTVELGAFNLGHLLGSGSDSQTECIGSGNIMSSRFNSRSTGRWNFSKCTAQSIKNYLGEYGANNCLIKEDFAGTYITALKPNSKLDITKASALCKRAFGDDYDTPSDKDILRYNWYQRMCKGMFCGKKGSFSYRGIMSSDGMECLKDITARGICKKGECV